MGNWDTRDWDDTETTFLKDEELKASLPPIWCGLEAWIESDALFLWEEAE